MARTGIVIALVALFLVPVAGEAGKKRDVIEVRDYTTWDGGEIARMVEEFNAVMPKNGPRLRYRRMTPNACTDAFLLKTKPSVVAVCTRPPHPNVAGTPAYQNIWLSENLVDDPPEMRYVLCHEMMHALTNQPDFYNKPWHTGGRFRDDAPYPDTSCLWGSLSTPGPFDVDLLRKAYAKKTRR